MPDDWNDHRGWDVYFESQLARKTPDPWDDKIGSIGVEELPGLAQDLKSRGWQNVWIPGCGLSPLGRLLAYLGLKVVTTDVSPTAVKFQRDKASELDHLVAGLG